MAEAYKRTLCLDFDGVLHSYASGWSSADRVSDEPVPGAMEALRSYVEAFRIAVYSSRTGQPGGVHAMEHWLRMHLTAAFGAEEGRRVADLVTWPHAKPPAHVTLDDRAVTFRGHWPSVESLATFEPWNKGGNPRGLEEYSDESLLRALRDRGYVSLRDPDADHGYSTPVEELRDMLDDDHDADSIVSRLDSMGIELIRTAHPEVRR